LNGADKNPGWEGLAGGGKVRIMIGMILGWTVIGRVMMARLAIMPIIQSWKSQFKTMSE
jgi:hypothetical protein